MSERGRVVSPQFHLVLCFTPSVVWEPHTVGCLPMCCSLIHCMATCYCEDVLCLKGFSARSPGSWLGGSWVSALLNGLFCWTPSQDLAPWSGVVLLFLCKISIHWHSCGLTFGAVLSVLLSLVFVFFVWFGCVALFGFVCFC